MNPGRKPPVNGRGRGETGRPGPASWPAQLRLRSEAESVRQSVQPRPDPNGSLALSVAHWPRHHHRDGLIAEMITVTLSRVPVSHAAAPGLRPRPP